MLVGGAEVVGPGGHRLEDLGRERLQLVGVVIEVLGPVVAQDSAGLAGVRPRDDGAVLRAGHQRVLVPGDGTGLRGGDETGADPHTVGAKGKGSGETTAVEDAAGSDDRDSRTDGVDDLRDERHRGDGAGVPARLGSLGDDEVAAAGDGGDGVAHLAAHRSDDDSGVVEAVDDVARNPEASDEQRRAAIDDVTDPGVHLVRKGREQVDTEWLRREGAHGGDLLGQLGRSHRRGPEGADATRLGHGSDEAVVGHPTHPGAHHRMFDVEQLGEPGAHRPDGSQPSA